MKQELLPCPFCGGEPVYSNYERSWYGCLNANCPASVISTSAATWNARAPDARVQLLARVIQFVLPVLADLEQTLDAGTHKGAMVWDVARNLREALTEAGIKE